MSETQPVAHPGQWRLDRIEVVHWGTFHGHHVVDVARKGFLLTGHSGSGKSSLVDAVAAVLTPRGRLRFNAAAADNGGRGQDRTVASYVRGAWSRQADADSGEVLTQFLRTGATWSGILLRYSDGTDRLPVHLAKLFHMRRGATTAAEVSELHLLTTAAVGLMDLQPYAANGLDTRRLKAAFPGDTVTDRHTVFAARVQRVLGIRGDNALELLHRTQAARNLTSLDELFRTSMLDVPITFRLADTAVEQFAELSQAHAAVVEARRQVDHLAPLVELSAAYDTADAAVSRAEILKTALPAVSRAWRRSLAEAEREDTRAELEVAQDAHRRTTEARERADRAVVGAEQTLEQQGGAALRAAASALEQSEAVVLRVRAARAEVASALAGVGVQMPTSASEWTELRALAGRERQAAADGATARKAGLADVYGAHARAREEVRRLQAELTALRGVSSNLDPALLQARRTVARSAGLAEGELPFAGELLQVRPEHTGWTGAIERALRPLAVVMLVPAGHRDGVVRAVDAHHLGARLLLEAVPATPAERPRQVIDERSLVRRVEVRTGAFAAWLEVTLSRLYDLPCVEHADELRPLERGLTRAGQVKRGPQRFEKDDRRPVNDRSRWILGWDNHEKVEHLLGLLRQAQEQERVAGAAADAAQSASDAELRRAQTLAVIETRAWPDLDVSSAESDHAQARRDHARLLAGASNLRAAQKALDDARGERNQAGEAEQKAMQHAADLNATVRRLEQVLTQLEQAEDTQVPDDVREELRQRYRSRRRSITSDTLDAVSVFVMGALDDERSAASGQRSAAERSIVRLLDAFRREWPALSADLTAEVADRRGYLEVLARLRGDRLPEFEERFFEMLATQSRRNIAQLRSAVLRALGEIRDKIDPINASLRRSEFDARRYLQIRPAENRTPAVQEFLADLKAIAEGSWADDDREAAERRFAVMARLISRLQSSETGDRAWRTACLDTRRHVTFTGLEVDADNVTLNVHDSAAGLSGGQRQKLVVFCLAAALRYQLAGAEATVPSYGTVVLDEAFDKADVRFTRMALDIFAEFGFHMVLATPLKLLQTLEDYIAGIAVVTCTDFKQSSAAQMDLRDGSRP